MSRLIESIKLRDGKFFNLRYHESRMSHALSAIFRRSPDLRLEEYLLGHEYPGNGLYKCRIVYDDVSRDVSFDPYEPRAIRTVKAVEDDSISYSYKFEDRGAINRLFSNRDGCDDILIIQRGKVTDCSYSNIVFRKGREWFTPDTPLLPGTMRQRLIDENKIRPREILATDIRSFDGFRIINAMLEFESAEIEVSKIVF